MPENEMSLAVFDSLKTINADIIAKDAVQEFDYTTPEGIERVRSWCHRLRGHKGDIERCRIASKEGAAKYVKQVNQVAKDLTEEVQTIHDVRMKPIKDIEAANRAEAEAIVAAEEAALAEKAAAEQKELEEFRAKAQAQQEKEAAEKAAQEQVEHEKRIAEEAEKKAIHDANELAKKVAFDASEATKKAEREKQETIDAAAKEVQRVKDEMTKIASDLKTEEARIASEALAKVESDAKIEAERVADKEHRRRIETGIHKAIWDAINSVEVVDEANFNQLAAVKVRDAIKEGKIPNVTINY